MAAVVGDPVALRRRLRSELREARNRAGLTQRDVAERLDWSPSKVIRIEAGQVAVSTVDLRALLKEYGVEDGERIAALEELARNSKKQPWSQYKDVLSVQGMEYFGYESSALRVRQFEPLLVPGLLQTERYTRAILRGAFGLAESVIDRHVDARKARQELLERKDRPELFFLLDEAVVRRPVGDPEIMAEQLDRLRELNVEKGVSIRVLRFDRGEYPGLAGPFIHLEFAGDEDDIVFIESRADQILTESQEDVGAYLDLFWAIEVEALSEEESNRFMAEVAAGWRR